MLLFPLEEYTEAPAAEETLEEATEEAAIEEVRPKSSTIAIMLPFGLAKPNPTNARTICLTFTRAF